MPFATFRTIVRCAAIVVAALLWTVSQSTAFGNEFAPIVEFNFKKPDSPEIKDASIARKLTRSLKKSGGLTLSVWLTPANKTQKGPARIITISKDTSNRNITLGQDQDRFDVRFRSTRTDKNGLPSLSSPRGTVKTKLTHVAFTRDKSGTTKLYINGQQVAKGKAAGSLKNWSDDYKLSIGDEVTGGRSWSGKLHRIRWFDQSLSPSTIVKMFADGREGRVKPKPTAKQLASRHFETKIAPLLAKNCLECHDVASAQGDLVLDQKDTAMQNAIVPGDPDNSPLWVSVDTDEMPHNRSPLLPEQKQLLRDWIAKGATWSLDWIDPADYQHDIGSTSGFVRRLTVEEYIRSVQVAVDVTIADEARMLLPPDVRADGFSNTAYNLSVDLQHIQAYAKLANTIVEKMPVKKFAGRFWPKARLTDKDMRGLIEKMGRWILRGPLDEHEIDLFRGISTTVAAAGGDYETATKATIAAMLQSPRFLYRIERQDESGRTDFVDNFELASRLSYLVWGAPPDRELMDAASEGELSDQKSVRLQVERMLKNPRAVDRSVDFISQWLNLNHVKSLRPDKKRFPDWNSDLADDMQLETREFFRHIVWTQRRPMTDLLHADVTFLTPALARHYGIEPNGKGINKYDLSDVPQRGGLLTQASVLTLGGDDASMVTRGLFVLNQLLRGVVNDPPPCVDTSPVPTAAGLSQRTIATERIENESCGGCHRKFEPLAFGLERYDGIGRYSVSDEHGNKLREDGEILVPGSAEPEQYKTSQTLMKMLARHDRVGESLVWKLTQFAIGRPLTSEDAPIVRQIYGNSKKQGGTYQATLTEIATSRLVKPSS